MEWSDSVAVQLQYRQAHFCREGEGRAQAIMKGLFCIVVILLAFSSQVYCDGPINDLFYNFTGNDTQELFTIYYFVVGVSINGQIGDVCAAGVSNETAGPYCRAIVDDIYGVPGFVPVSGNIAYPDNFQYFPEEYSYSYTNVSCSNGYTSCTGSQMSNCSASGGLLSLQCSIIQPECYYGETDLNNYVNISNSSDLFTLTGRPTICIGGTFFPVCSGVSLSPIDISRICIYSLGLSSGFVGAPAGVMVPPLNLTRDLGTVVTGLECTGLQNCTNTTMYGDCPNDYATVTCQRVCVDNDDVDHDVFLFNEYSGSEGGNTYIAGIPQFCADGAFTRICNDGTNSPGIINYACNILGYQYGQLLPYNASVYNGTPPGVVYLSNFSCNASDMCGEYANFATDPRCFGGSLDYFIKCYNETSPTTATTAQSTTSATVIITTTGGASTTPSSTPTESSSSNVGLIVGVTIAVVVVVGLIVAAVIIVVFIIIRRRRSGSFSF